MASLHEAADTKTNCGAWHFFGKNNLRKERTFSIRKPNDPTCCPSVFPLHFAPTFCHYISPLRVAATFHLYVLPLHFTPTFCHYISPLLFATTFAPTPLRLPLYLLRHCSTRQRIFAAERRWHSGFLTVMVWFRTEVWQQCSLEQMAKNEHWGITKQSTVLLAREWRGYFSLLFYLFCSVDIALYRVTSSLPHATRETSNIHRSNKEHTTVCPKDTLLFAQRTHYCLPKGHTTVCPKDTLLFVQWHVFAVLRWQQAFVKPWKYVAATKLISKARLVVRGSKQTATLSKWNGSFAAFQQTCGWAPARVSQVSLSRI